MKIETGKIFAPANFAIIAVLASFFSWMIPDFGVIKKGYTVQSEWTVTSFVILLDWYLLVYVAAFLGQLIGVRIYNSKLKKINMPSIDDKYVLLLFTGLAAAGIFATYYKIFTSLSLVEAFLFISSGMANELKESLYDDYSAGIVSLRYLVLYSSSISFYKYYVDKKINIIMIGNFLLLVLSAMLSSRLIFVATVLVTFFLCTSQKKYISIKTVKITAWLMLLFIVLSLLNYSRNSNYYEADGLYFWGAGLSAILAYLGSPFQVAVGAADNISRLAFEGAEAYRNFVDIDITLNTNSAFVHSHELLGYWAWPYVVLLLMFFGILFGYMRSYGRSALLLPCGAIIYGYAEFWRIDLFRQGIFIVWIVFGVIIPIFVGICLKNK